MGTRRVASILISLAFIVAPLSAASAETAGLGSFDIVEGSLLDPSTVVTYQPPALLDVAGVEFTFTNARGEVVSVGTDAEGSRRSFFTVCPARGSCDGPRQYSTKPGSALRTQPEGWGTLAARQIDGRTDLASVRVRWDNTPPRARITSPTFSEAGRAWLAQAVTLDEDVISFQMQYLDLSQFILGRDIPLLAQRTTGDNMPDWGGCCSCAPTAFAANMRWLDNQNYHTVADGQSDHDLIVAVGDAMDTGDSGCCTTGNGYRNGVNEYMASVGYDAGDFEVENPSPEGSVGFTPEQVAESFYAGNVVTLGLYNLPGNAGFGHVVALDNVTVHNNGTAHIRIMDPFTSPAGPLGAYRSLLLHANGTLDWDPNSGYYNASQVQLGALSSVYPYLFDDLSAQSLAVGGPADRRDPRPWQSVPTIAMPDGRSWLGAFVPLPTSAGPWLLRTTSTDAAGYTQTDLQLVRSL